jgi:hypothetical protein
MGITCMQIEVNVSEKNSILTVTGHGELNIQSMIELFEDIASHHGNVIRSGYSVVLDYHQATGSFSLTEIRTMASMYRKYADYYNNNKIALIVRKEEVHKASILCLLTRGFGVRIEAYSDKESAMKFLSGVSGK